MSGGKKCSLRRPLHKQLSPVFPVYDGLRRVLLVVPKDTNIVAAEYDELISAIGVTKPGPEVLSFSKRCDFRLNVFIINLSFTAILLNIGQLVDSKGMLLVQGNAVKLLRSGNGLFGCLIFDKGESLEQLVSLALKRYLFWPYPSDMPCSFMGM